VIWLVLVIGSGIVYFCVSTVRRWAREGAAETAAREAGPPDNEDEARLLAAADHAGEELTRVAAEMHLPRQTWGSVVAKLDALELRSTAVLQWPLDARGRIDSEGRPRALELRPDLIINVSTDGEITQTYDPGKSRRTATRVALGGALGGAAGAAAGSMSKKQTRAPSVGSYDGRQLLISLASPAHPSSVLQAEFPISKQAEVQAFVTKLQAACASDLDAIKLRLGKERARLGELEQSLRTAEAEARDAYLQSRRASTSAAAAERRTNRNRRTQAEIGVRLVDMTSAGFLAAPVVLTGSPNGKRVKATLNADGTIEFRGEIYGSPSGAAKAAKIATMRPEEVPAKVSADGYKFWSVADRRGHTTTLAELRRQFAEAQSDWEGGG
jgi:hypothetical protein